MRIGRCMILCMMIALLVCGCAGRQKELLGKDYMTMTNDELLRYYYELNDEISRCVNDSSGVSVGVGSGYWLHRIGIGLGLSHGVPMCNPDKLRRRRIDVRIEMRHRGLNP